MCYINGCRVSRETYIRYKNLLKELKNLNLYKAVQTGFDYRDWPIVIPIQNGNDVEIVLSHWEFIPPSIHSAEELFAARKQGIPWLNAKSETLLESKMFRNAALNGRCLVLSTGFYEYRHVPKFGKKGQELKATERYPYFISVSNDQPCFFMAGIHQKWTNHVRGESADTFAIVTTEANELMQQVHNSKKRMPTILNQELAEEWLSPNLSEERIKQIASTQYDSENMFAYPVAKDFINSEEPEKEFDYPGLPPLI